MACADLVHLPHFDSLGFALIDKPQLFLHAAAFLVAVVIAAPDAVHTEILKRIAKHLARGFGNEPLPPIWLSDPIAKLIFIVRFGKVVAMKSDAADGLAALLEVHSKGVGRRQHRANDLAAVFHARVGRPPGETLI